MANTGTTASTKRASCQLMISMEMVTDTRKMLAQTRSTRPQPKASARWTTSLVSLLIKKPTLVRS